MQAPQAGQESVNIYPLLLSREAALCVSQPQPLSPRPFLQAIQLWPQTCTFVQPNKTLKLTELSTLESNLGTITCYSSMLLRTYCDPQLA